MFTLLNESLLLREQRRLEINDVLVEAGILQEDIELLTPLLLEDEELINEFFGALKGYLGKKAIGVGKGLGKLAAASYTKGTEMKKQVGRDKLKMAHRQAVKDLGAAYKSGDEAKISSARDKLAMARHYNRAAHGRAKSLMSQPSDTDIKKDPSLKSQRTALGMKINRAPVRDPKTGRMVRGTKVQASAAPVKAVRDPFKGKKTQEAGKRAEKRFYMRFANNSSTEHEGTALNEHYTIIYEMLSGKQHKLDVNKNGRLDSQDFKMLRRSRKPKKVKITEARKVHKVGETTPSGGIRGEPGTGKKGQKSKTVPTEHSRGVKKSYYRGLDYDASSRRQDYLEDRKRWRVDPKGERKKRKDALTKFSQEYSDFREARERNKRKK
jgi:hypothetical protein